MDLSSNLVFVFLVNNGFLDIPRKYHRFIRHRSGIPPTYVNRSIGWRPQPMETPTLKGGKDDREESHDRREGEGWFIWTHITPTYRHREQGILSKVYPHHSNRIH